MVLDATVATGAAAMMAIRVLLDHDVPEENIMLLSLIMAESGTFFYKNVSTLTSSFVAQSIGLCLKPNTHPLSVGTCSIF